MSCSTAVEWPRPTACSDIATSATGRSTFSRQRVKINADLDFAGDNIAAAVLAGLTASGVSAAFFHAHVGHEPPTCAAAGAHDPSTRKGDEHCAQRLVALAHNRRLPNGERLLAEGL